MRCNFFMGCEQKAEPGQEKCQKHLTALQKAQASRHQPTPKRKTETLPSASVAAPPAKPGVPSCPDCGGRSSTCRTCGDDDDVLDYLTTPESVIDSNIKALEADEARIALAQTQAKPAPAAPSLSQVVAKSLSPALVAAQATPPPAPPVPATPTPQPAPTQAPTGPAPEKAPVMPTNPKPLGAKDAQRLEWLTKQTEPVTIKQAIAAWGLAPGSIPALLSAFRRVYPGEIKNEGGRLWVESKPNTLAGNAKAKAKAKVEPPNPDLRGMSSDQLVPLVREKSKELADLKAACLEAIRRELSNHSLAATNLKVLEKEFSGAPEGGQ